MGTHLLFKELNVQIFSGESVGIVGPNGCGKSTLLKLIAGIEPLNVYIGSWSEGYDYGWIQKPKEATIAYLDQAPTYPENYDVEAVLRDAFSEVLEIEQTMRQLEKQMASLEGETLESALKKYAEKSAVYEAKEGYAIQEKMRKICVGLGFDDAFLKREFKSLSGGEQTRVVLGKILLDKPDVLLLDEPTNHLDTEAIEWLEAYLKTYPGILIVVSHDRYFLDQVVTKVIEIENLQAQAFKGNYSAYVTQKEEQVRIQYADFLEQKKKIKQMENQVKKLRDWAIRADNNKFFRRAASIQKKLEKMDRVQKPKLEREAMGLDLSTNSRTGRETIRLEDLTKSFDEKMIFKGAELLVAYGQRMALIGPNGSGKTTLLKLILGEILPDGGRVKLAETSKVAYLPQQIEFDTPSQTVLDYFREDLTISEGEARKALAQYLFFGERVFTTVSDLSGGEKVRLKLARLLYDEVNVLILDEPTNHLDIDSIEAMEEALETFKGTLFFVSHDRYFINAVKAQIVAVESQQLKVYLGDYDAYKATKKVISVEAETQKKDVKETDSQKSAPNQTRKASNKVNWVKIELIESDIAVCEANLQRIGEEMMKQASDYEALNKLNAEKETYQNELDLLLSKWLELQPK